MKPVPYDFVCVECGRAITMVVGEPPVFKLCATCVCLPGWFRYPELKRMLDPGGALDLPASEREP